jgi:hypothetical protein
VFALARAAAFLFKASDQSARRAQAAAEALDFFLQQ